MAAGVIAWVGRGAHPERKIAESESVVSTSAPDPRERLARLAVEMRTTLEEIGRGYPSVGERGPAATHPRTDCAICGVPLGGGAYLACDSCYERALTVAPELGAEIVSILEYRKRRGG